jgi:hypothetical protein
LLGDKLRLERAIFVNYILVNCQHPLLSLQAVFIQLSKFTRSLAPCFLVLFLLGKCFFRLL